jgi:hypothetical protein
MGVMQISVVVSAVASSEARMLRGRAQLLDECLQCVDPVLYQHLAARQLTAKVYAFPCT